MALLRHIYVKSSSHLKPFSYKHLGKNLTLGGISSFQIFLRRWIGGYGRDALNLEIVGTVNGEGATRVRAPNHFILQHRDKKGNC